MNAYHVFVVNTKSPPNGLELLVQMYSCIYHKRVNGDTPLYLITDKKSKEFYDGWNITPLYDGVITDYFDDYPYDDISSNFWASPKIWAMSKLKAPFVIYDTDLVLYRNLKKDSVGVDIMYLHLESGISYGNPLDIEHSDKWEWDDDMVKSFKDTFPMNTAVFGVFNDEFRKEYVDNYFKFVLGGSGEVKNMTKEKEEFYAASSPQIIAEQWLLSALINYKRVINKKHIKSKSLIPVIFTSEDFYSVNELLYNLDDNSSNLIDSSMYHLWGAKKYMSDTDSEQYQKTKSEILGALSIATDGKYSSLLKDKVELIINNLD